MKIAIEGCCHGELEKIYATLEHLEKENNVKVDLLIICGDFQAMRNERDLDSMAVPEKYREMCSFWKYYAEVEKAPVLTLFIGGNHEASNYLSELPYGGWVAPNIYYMGYANVVNFAGLRIAGLSGIYKPADYYKGHFELPPYNPSTAHSVYHVRNLEIYRLSQLKPPIDIMVTHDWPTGVYHHGNINELIRIKPYFADEIQANTLGSVENERLLKLLKPKYWFSAHLHVKFSALYKHEKDDAVTKFLALDKCLPRRGFLQVLDIEPNGPPMPKSLHLDPEWLVILKKTDHMLSVETYNQAPLPLNKAVEVLQSDLDEIKEDFQDSFEIPLNFKRTAPKHSINQNEQSTNSSSVSAVDDSSETSSASTYNNDYYLNEQTTLMCEMLSIRDPIRIILEKRGKSSVIAQSTTQLYNDLLDQSDDE